MNMPWFISKIISILRCHVNDDMIKMELYNGQYLFDYLYQTYAISTKLFSYCFWFIYWKNLTLMKKISYSYHVCKSLDERFIYPNVLHDVLCNSWWIPRYTKTNGINKNCANQSYERVHKIQIVNFIRKVRFGAQHSE